jgi:tetratricopeptide (TPR) repeat protein
LAYLVRPAIFALNAVQLLGFSMAKETASTLCQKAQQAVAHGKNELARQYFQHALALEADDPDIHYGMATVCFLLNDLDTSVHHFAEVTRLDPHRAGAYINLGAVYNRLEQYDEAIPYLRRGIQLDMNRAEGYYNLGLVYRRKGQLDMAVQAYREAVRVNPRMADAHFNIANIYLETAQFRLAAAHYRQALELRPNWEKAQRGLKQAEQAQHSEEAGAATQERAPAPAPPQAPAVPTAPALDPNREVDPDQHGNLLRFIHQTTIDLQNQGSQFLDMLENDLEPAIKELSILLLTPSTSQVVLETCLAKFEQAVATFLSQQADLRERCSKVHQAGEELLNT